jgi:hypothetical protein
MSEAKNDESELNALLCAAFSYDRGAWCVFKRLDDFTMSFLWRCHTQEAAKKLADDVNNGATICRGSKYLGGACGKCVKCELTA